MYVGLALIDIQTCSQSDALKEEIKRRKLGSTSPTDTWEDLFFRVFLDHVEPDLGREKPLMLYEYPASMAALARLAPGNPLVAERFEVYIAGLEIANAFSDRFNEK